MVRIWCAEDASENSLQASNSERKKGQICQGLFFSFVNTNKTKINKVGYLFFPSSFWCTMIIYEAQAAAAEKTTRHLMMVCLEDLFMKPKTYAQCMYTWIRQEKERKKKQVRPTVLYTGRFLMNIDDDDEDRPRRQTLSIGMAAAAAINLVFIWWWWYDKGVLAVVVMVDCIFFIFKNEKKIQNFGFTRRRK